MAKDGQNSNYDTPSYYCKSRKQHPVRFTRGYGSLRMRPFVREPLQCFNCQKFGHQARTCRSGHRWETRIEPVQGQQKSHTKVRKLWTGACHHQSALPQETGSREQSKDFAHTITENTYNQTSQQKPSPHSIEKRMGNTDRTGSGITALFRKNINSTNQNHRGTNESKYQTTKTNSKELNTKNNAEQEVGTGKGGILPTTNDQCLDKVLRTINEGVSGSYVSELDKIVTFRTIGQSIPTSQLGTNTTNRRRTNGRCPRYNTHCTHRCNISTQEDFYREHLSSTCTQ